MKASSAERVLSRDSPSASTVLAGSDFLTTAHKYHSASERAFSRQTAGFIDPSTV
jgi:hypothetical protein